MSIPIGPYRRVRRRASHPVVRRRVERVSLTEAQKIEAAKLIDQMGDGFSEVFDLLSEDDIAEMGDKLADSYHKPLDRLRKLLGIEGMPFYGTGKRPEDE